MKITIEIETLPDFLNVPEVYLIFPVDSSGANMIRCCAADNAEADITGAIPIEKDAREFSFVLTRIGIDALDGGFGFETLNVAVKSVYLEATDEALGGFKATPHNYRLSPLPHACLHIFRYLAQISFERRQPVCTQFVQSNEKSAAQSHGNNCAVLP